MPRTLKPSLVLLPGTERVVCYPSSYLGSSSVLPLDTDAMVAAAAWPLTGAETAAWEGAAATACTPIGAAASGSRGAYASMSSTAWVTADQFARDPRYCTRAAMRSAGFPMSDVMPLKGGAVVGGHWGATGHRGAARMLGSTGGAPNATRAISLEGPAAGYDLSRSPAAGSAAAAVRRAISLDLVGSPSISPSISYADAQEAAEVAAAIAAVEAVRVVEAAEAAEAAAARAPAPYVTAYAAEIAVLREMGFDTEAAGSALVATSGDIDRAAERLASQPD